MPPPASATSARTEAGAGAGAGAGAHHHNSHRQHAGRATGAPAKKTEADLARELQRERERSAAKEAQRELWERTRGAGSSVLALYDDEFRSRAIDTWDAEDVLPTLEEVQTKKYDPVEVPSADLLLTRGISEYTMLPKVLGRGKFSTVFLAAKNGHKYAIKHTALFPHHPLISTRLLREPTLLAELPPHPNLVTVNETIRTPGHFYLVEEYLGGYVTLEALIPLLNKQPPDQPARLPDDAAEKIFQQLISVVNSIHTPLQICHRDIKPENILVHPVSLQLKLLDFGLATHFSRSEPKLSTCCGSPAFHCPEIVKALASPPGSVMYWGPEVDAWTCGITMLRCLTGVLYPLGAQHTSLRSMAIRAQRSVGMVSNPSLRDRIAKLVDMDGVKRMRYFQEMNAEQERLLGEPLRVRKEFKSTTYIPSEPSHTMRLPLLVGAAAEQAEALASGQRSPLTSSRTTPNTSRAPSPSPLRHTHGVHSQSAVVPSGTKTMVLLNPTSQPPQRVLSFIKYCLRCAGILYHCWPDASSAASAPALAASMLPLSATNASVPELSCPPSPAPGGGASTPGWASLSSERLEIPGVLLSNGNSTSNGSGNGTSWSHIHIFQCVLHLPEPVEEPEQQLSLVQTIMAAFGRRAAPNAKRSLSQPPKPKTDAAATPTAAAAAADKSAKAAADAAVAAASGNGGKASVRCLPFWMVVRFAPAFASSPSSLSKSGGGLGSPTSGNGTLAKQGSSSGAGAGAGDRGGPAPSYHRSSSLAGRRSRVGSAAAAESAGGTLAGGAPLHKTTSRSSDHSPGASNRTSEDLPSLREGTPTYHSSRSPRIGTDPQGTESAGGSSSARPSGERQRSGSYSRAHSRQRLRSRVSHAGAPPSKPKIFIYVSDERALPALQKALSVGGTSEGSDAEEELVEGKEKGSSPSAGTGTAGRASADEIRPSPNSPGFERKARPSILRSHTFASAATHNGVANTMIHSTTHGGLPFPSVHEGEDGTHTSQQQQNEVPRGRAAHARRSESHRAFRTQSQASVRPSYASRSTLTSEELERKLDAVQAALRPVLTRSGRSHGRADGTGSGERSGAGTGNGGGENGLVTVEQARLNLAGLLQMLHDAERAQGPVLQAALSPLTFQLFSVLTPVLGLEPIRIPHHHRPTGKSGDGSSPTRASADARKKAGGSASSGKESVESRSTSPVVPTAPSPADSGSDSAQPGPTPSTKVAPTTQEQQTTLPKSSSSSSSFTDSLDEPTPMSKMARQALELAAQYSSAREMFLAVQERLDLLSTQAEEAAAEEEAANWGSDRGGPGEEASTGVAVGPSATPNGGPGGAAVERKSVQHARRPATKGWDGGLELNGLIGLLSIVIPRIKTRKPHNFSESLASLIPRAAKALLSQKRSRKSQRALGKAPEKPGGLSFRQQNALSVLRSVVELAKVTNAWERKCLAEDQKTDSVMASSATTLKAPPKRSSDVAVMFLATFTALLPHLPNLRLTPSGTASGLSEAHFFTKNPKYALQRPQSNGSTPAASTTGSPVLGGGASNAAAAPSAEETNALWQDVGKAMEGLHDSVHTIAFGASGPGVSVPHSSEDNSDLRAAAVTSVGAFICLVQMLALGDCAEGSRSSSLGVELPGEWTPAQAHVHLTLSLPVVLAGLRSHATVKLNGGMAAAADEGSKGQAPTEPLEDAALVWILWCLEALEASAPDERMLIPEVAIQLVQALSMHAAQSASVARLISFILVKQIIVHHVTGQTAADLLFDIVGPECPFANLRSAGVGMVRDIIDLKLTKYHERKRNATGASQALIEGEAAEGVLSPAFLRRLRTVLFTLPPGFESVKEASEAQASQVLRVRVFLDDNSAWLSECCHTLYYLLKRDEANLTGIQEPALKDELLRIFVKPLRSLITNWQAQAPTPSQSSPTASAQQKEASVDSQRQALESVAVSLGVISMGLDLVEGVMSSSATGGASPEGTESGSGGDDKASAA
ncbi:hypothetical protein OC834_001352 [Tilletia horrida]|nr:hypothetical protein OC834_001352 [Tilletia horrida]